MLNRVVLIGRLTKDPDLRYTPSGVAVAQFTLAVNRSFTNQQGEREADFIPIVTWRQLAENCANYLRKGRLAAVDGRIQVRSYDNNEGKRVYMTEVIAEDVRFLESASSTRGEGDSQGGGYTERSQPRPNTRANTNQTQTQNNGKDPFHDDGKPVDISDDDLPF